MPYNLPPPTSYSHFRSGSSNIDFSPVLSSAPWQNPIWEAFPQDIYDEEDLRSGVGSFTQHPIPQRFSDSHDSLFHQQFHHSADHLPNRHHNEVMSPFPWLFGLSILGSIASTPLQVKYSWNTVDFAFPTAQVRQDAIQSGKFIPINNLPLGIETWNGRTFVTLPKWKPGVPATLAVIPPKSGQSPLLQPYPNWNWHKEGNCNGLTSVFRLSIDSCGRLWVLDSGVIDVLNSTNQICPSQIVVFDLKTDKLLWRYRIPKDQLKEGSLFTNIVTDIREGKCEDAFAYLTDVFRYGVVVYNWREDRSWRISHNLFYPDPIACRYSLDNITFRWTDGVFGVALSDLDPETKDRTLYYHPMSSFREFSVPTSILRNDTADDHPEEFKVLGEPRGKENQHASASAMGRNGVLFFNLVTQNSVGCWDTRKPYTKLNIGSIGQDPEALNFPNDLKIDYAKKQSIWVLSNKLHKYLYTGINPDETNFRVLTASVDDIVKGTICDPETPAAIDLSPKCLDEL